MKDFFYGGVHKKGGGSIWLDEYEEELAIKKAKEFSKGMTMEKIRARLAEMDEQEAKALMNDDDIIVHILQPKEHIMGLVRKYFPQYEHGTPAFDAKVEQIVKHNKIKNRHTVLIGQRIEIPITKAEREAIQAFEKYENENKSNEKPISFDNLFHYVQKGETLDSIIQKYFPYLEIGSPDYKEKEREFMERHDLKSKKDIKIGQQLVVVVNPKERQKADEYYQKNKTVPNPYFGNVGDMLYGDLLEKKQIDEIAQQNNLDVDVVLANRMPEKEVKQNLFFQKSKYKHLASHGGHGNMITGETYLPSKNDAQDNQLNDSEIKNIPLSETELAFLAICGSGDGEANQSLAKSFMDAGVNQTISMQWNLNSEFSVVFTKVFYQKLAENHSKEISQTLRETQIEFLKQGSKPSDWAIFKHLDKRYTKEKYLSDFKETQKILNDDEAVLNIIIEKESGDDSYYKIEIIEKKNYLSFTINMNREDVWQKNALKLYSNNKIRNHYNNINLYNKIWGNIESKFHSNIKKIFFNNEGIYTSATLKSIFDPQTNLFLIEKYDIINLY